MMKTIRFLVFALFLLLILNVTVQADSVGHREEDVVKVYDQEGNYIFASAMGITRGDQYIDEKNRQYEIEEVDGQQATARYLGTVELPDVDTLDTSLFSAARDKKKLIGLYNTHNDESYVPGPVNVNGQGEIHDVAGTLQAALEKQGIKVILSSNLHLPHDGAAYDRSRATALALAKDGPAALFDVHRDAVPDRKEYLARVNGQEVSRVRLVVGRQNPNVKVNDKFARTLKAITDKKFPGLIKGIFYGKGSYNQEISPRALLFEFGTHVTTENEAKNSAAMLAQSIDLLLFGGKGGQMVNKGSESRSGWTAALWIILIAVVGIFIFLFINEGSLTGVMDRLRNFVSREILDRGKK